MQCELQVYVLKSIVLSASMRKIGNRVLQVYLRTKLWQSCAGFFTLFLPAVSGVIAVPLTDLFWLRSRDFSDSAAIKKSSLLFISSLWIKEFLFPVAKYKINPTQTLLKTMKLSVYCSTASLLPLSYVQVRDKREGKVLFFGNLLYLCAYPRLTLCSVLSSSQWLRWIVAYHGHVSLWPIDITISLFLRG